LVNAGDTSCPANASRHIALRHSIAVRAATLAFALIAAVAVHCVVLPRGGDVAAAMLAAATFGALALAALVRERRQPAALSLEPDGIAAYCRSGGLLLRGRIAGCAQWADRLLLIAVMPHGGARAAPLVIAADALPAEAFRELAVRARYAAR
jgi:hypothetical protein